MWQLTEQTNKHFLATLSIDTNSLSCIQQKQDLIIEQGIHFKRSERFKKHSKVEKVEKDMTHKLLHDVKALRRVSLLQTRSERSVKEKVFNKILDFLHIYFLFSVDFYHILYPVAKF